jgi:hypothetical protein
MLRFLAAIVAERIALARMVALDAAALALGSAGEANTAAKRVRRAEGGSGGGGVGRGRVFSCAPI